MISYMIPDILSLPAEHIPREGKQVPLCSRVARKNLGLLLGVPHEQLDSYEIYKDLQFAPIGRATEVHNIYRD